MRPHELFPIIERLEKCNITYSLGGSAVLYDLKLVDAVNDWDLTVDCAKETLIEAIQDYDWAEQKSGDPPFASQYRIKIDSLNIEFIGYFALHTDHGVLRLPVSHLGTWDGIPLSSPEIWYVAYYLMNRKTKANLLLNYLKENRSTVNAALIRQLINTKMLNDELAQELGSLCN